MKYIEKIALNRSLAIAVCLSLAFIFRTITAYFVYGFVAFDDYNWESFVGFSDNFICPGHDIFFHYNTLAFNLID